MLKSDVENFGLYSEGNMSHQEGPKQGVIDKISILKFLQGDSQEVNAVTKTLMMIA